MIIYTRHAEKQLKFRDISKKEIELTINSPNFTEQGRENKVVYYRNFGCKYLRAILVQNKAMLVITAHWIASRKIKIKK